MENDDLKYKVTRFARDNKYIVFTVILNFYTLTFTKLTRNMYIIM